MSLANTPFAVKQLTLATIVACTCLLGDSLVDIFQTKNRPLAAAICDNLTHGIIGALTTLLVLHHYHDRIPFAEHKLLIAFGFFAATIIDVDHFIEAQSIRLEVWTKQLYIYILFKNISLNSTQDATNLSHRPFLHCSNIPFIILLLFIVGNYFQSFRLNLWLAILFMAFFVHHTRDATRRGFWIRPYGHTTPIPYVAYVFLSVLTPYVVISLMHICRGRWKAGHTAANNNRLIFYA